MCVILPLLTTSCKKDSSTAQQTTTTTTTTTGGSTSTGTQTYKKVWADEFDSTAIDTKKWNFETGNLNVNDEKEYYQAANAAVSNGNLVITAKQQNVGGQPYTSARLNTSGKFSIQYGRIEARIKLPLGAGLWPAFWMLGSNISTVGWPQCGEIDIMEHINADSLIYGTMHWNSNGAVQYGQNLSTSPSAYHVYAVEWTPQSINWYVDDKLYVTGNIANSINNTGAFNTGSFFILLNLAVAGDWPGQTVDISKLPASMYVDYVRVYQLSN